MISAIPMRALFILALTLLSACSPQAPQPTPTPRAEAPQNRLVLAFGDSLYAGYGVLPQQAFPYVLEQRLKASGARVLVRNAGVSGDTTAAGLRRLKPILDGLGRTPDLAIVGLGGNDMLRGVDPAETRANLDAICAELGARGIPILLTGMRALPNRDPAYIRAFETIYPDLARKHDAVLDPFFLDGVALQPALMLPDRLHPNRQGIERIATRLTPLVAKALKR